MSSERRGRLVRGRRRIAVGAVLTALVSTLTVGTSSAQAADGPCPAGLQWSVSDNGWFQEAWAVQYVVNSVTPDFLVSEQRVVNNGTSSPISATFTSSQSKTFTLTVSTGANVSFFNFLTANVSASITTSTTTTTGVSATAPVPAFGRVVGQYGVEAFHVAYTMNFYHDYGNNPPGPLCSLESSTQGTSVAPTTNTGWRVLPG
ncbi:hypothetical protein ACLVWQ_06060 [Streptomyces sp. CWNU-52B]|uniref:hypothetical protein n=1 Tax=unclassified Streptomyces TaxID=2593676 RepID=UPI0039BFD9F8